MKTLYLFFAFFLLAAGNTGAQDRKNKVTLKGQLKNFTNQVEVEDLSDFQYLLPPNTERMVVPDTAGNFHISFSLQQPNYFRMGRNILYLTPGDDMEVFIDKNNPVAGQFKGRGSAANLYLRNTPFPKGGSYVEAGRKIQKTAKATIDTLYTIAARKQKELDQLNGVSDEFRRLEHARIKADLINSLRAGISSYKPRLTGDSLNAYLQEYKTLATPLIREQARGFVDASLMKLVVYRDIVSEVLKEEGQEKDRAQIADYMEAYELVSEMKKVSEKEKLRAFAKRIDALKTTAYKNAVEASQSNLLKFGKGDPAIDFTAMEPDGRKVNLSSLKGKVIYVDLWATWCGPCLAEMPHYETLKNKYRENEEVAFVSLSIDDGMELWKKNLAQRKADGIQWLINRNNLHDYDIVSIPRSLLIDRNFNIVVMNAPMPSSKDISSIIDSLLK
jgi:thiol-disulfide isomerase/thioredoxin